MVCRAHSVGDEGEGLIFTSQMVLFRDQERNPMFAAAKMTVLCAHKRVKKATVDYFDIKLLAIHEGLIMTWHTSSCRLN